MLRTHRVLLVLAALVLTSCGAPQLPTSPSGMTAPSGSGGGKYQCKNVSGQTNPWLIEWNGADRARLQAMARQGVLLVSYSGCELKVLYDCLQAGTYDLEPTTVSTATEYITNEGDIFAKLPIGALTLASEYKQGDNWSLDYAILGMQLASVRNIDKTKFAEECASATHFVSNMAVGAFKLVSESKRKIAAGVEVLGAGAGASTGGSAGALRQAGIYDKCTSGAASGDQDCQAIVRLYLEPLHKNETSAADSEGDQPKADAIASGALSKELIRRVVHRHIDEVKLCYETALVSKPDLSGRVSITFVITGSGAVQLATVAESTLGNPQVEICITTAANRWVFPPPKGGGLVLVTYPFELTSKDEPETNP